MSKKESEDKHTKQDRLFFEPSHTQDDVRSLIEATLTVRMTRVERINYGEANAVYTVQTSDGDEYILKVSPNVKGENYLLQEAWAFDRCRNIGIPVPEVICADASLTKFPEVYLLTRRIPGTPGSEIKFTNTELLDLMRQTGHYLNLIHSVTVQGFGEIIEDKNQFRGAHDALWESIMSVLDNSKWMDVIRDHRLLAETDLNRYRKLLEDHKDLFGLKTASLTHGDIGPRNLIIRGSKIVGIVDMENVLATDPVRDFHWFGYWIEGSQRLKALQDGYDNKKIFGDSFIIKMKLFQIVYSLPALTYYQNRNEVSSLNYLQQKISQADQLLQSLT